MGLEHLTVGNDCSRFVDCGIDGFRGKPPSGTPSTIDDASTGEWPVGPNAPSCCAWTRGPRSRCSTAVNQHYNCVLVRRLAGARNTKGTTLRFAANDIATDQVSAHATAATNALARSRDDEMMLTLGPHSAGDVVTSMISQYL